MNEKVGIGVLCILYLVGFVGIGLNVAPELIFLTPLNLIISLLVAKHFESNSIKSYILFSIPVFLLGYGIEVAGVQTGVIFGEYEYGSILGIKFWRTPLMIGVNWVLLTYAAGYTVNTLSPNLNSVIKAAIAATLLVLLDFLIEPVAVKWDMWSWAEVDIPMQNYLAWWLIAFIMMQIFYYSFKNSTNKVAVAVLIIQFLFFGLLNLSSI